MTFSAIDIMREVLSNVQGVSVSGARTDLKVGTGIFLVVPLQFFDSLSSLLYN